MAAEQLGCDHQRLGKRSFQPQNVHALRVREGQAALAGAGPLSQLRPVWAALV